MSSRIQIMPTLEDFIDYLRKTQDGRLPLDGTTANDLFDEFAIYWQEEH